MGKEETNKKEICGVPLTIIICIKIVMESVIIVLIQVEELWGLQGGLLLWLQ